MVLPNEIETRKHLNLIKSTTPIKKSFNSEKEDWKYRDIYENLEFGQISLKRGVLRTLNNDKNQ